MKVIGYVRVSTEDQGKSGHGLAAQRASLEQFCAAKDFELLTITQDVVSAAKADKLHGREVAVAAIEGGVADALLVRALDRASRDQLDAAKLYRRAEDYGWRLLDCEGADSGDPAQRLVADVRLAVAAEERRKVRTRTQEALRRAKADGKQIGRPTQIPREVERRIMVLRSESKGPKAIAAQLTREGIPTPRGGAAWHHSSIRTALARLEA